MSEKGTTDAIVVVIEWGGRKPSTTFYNRMHAYGLYSRSPKNADVSLLEWRAGQRGNNKSPGRRGLILQEGLIVVNSMTLARDIARWAKRENKAAVVQIGRMTVSDFTMSERDYAVIEKLQDGLSKRGPKVVGDAGFYAVTCFDDVKTYSVEAKSMPVMCPLCGGSNIQSRMGQVHVYQKYNGADDKLDYWARTRFSEGTFEVPVLKEDDEQIYPVPPEGVSVKLPELNLSDAVLAAHAEADQYFHLMDVVYCVSTMTDAHRLDGRIPVIESYVRSGGQRFMSFNPSQRIDIVDLCILDRMYTKYL